MALTPERLLELRRDRRRNPPGTRPRSARAFQYQSIRPQDINRASLRPPHLPYAAAINAAMVGRARLPTIHQSKRYVAPWEYLLRSPLYYPYPLPLPELLADAATLALQSPLYFALLHTPSPFRSAEAYYILTAPASPTLRYKTTYFISSAGTIRHTHRKFPTILRSKAVSAEIFLRRLKLHAIRHGYAPAIPPAQRAFPLPPPRVLYHFSCGCQSLKISSPFPGYCPSHKDPDNPDNAIFIHTTLHKKQ